MRILKKTNEEINDFIHMLVEKNVVGFLSHVAYITISIRVHIALNVVSCRRCLRRRCASVDDAQPPPEFILATIPQCPMHSYFICCKSRVGAYYLI